MTTAPNLLDSQLDALIETNELLLALNAVGRTLPTSLNQRGALEATRNQLSATFGCTVICLLELNEAHAEWVPKITEGCVVRPTSTVDELHAHLRRALDSEPPHLEDGLPGIGADSRSGLYARLTVGERLVGALAIEHREAGYFTAEDQRLLAAMIPAMALTLDNARWFGHLRSLGAEEERVRTARSLHDRLGQWLTYVGVELERFAANEGAGFPAITHLHSDVQRALDDLRETIHQLRSGVSETRPLAMAAADLAAGFAARTGLEVVVHTADEFDRLPVPVETELYRILQEALNNIDQHAAASRVTVTWRVDDDGGELIVSDDGRGFDPDRGVREFAYGLVGMRERADVIGARLRIESAPVTGTSITVAVRSTATPREA